MGGDRREALSVALSGGGYRAAVFGADALLAVVDNGLGPTVSSVSSVSGGSFANALTDGGFRGPEEMADRVRLVAGVAQSDIVATERHLRDLLHNHLAMAAGIAITLALFWLFLDRGVGVLFRGLAMAVLGVSALALYHLPWIIRSNKTQVSRAMEVLHGRRLTLSELGRGEEADRVLRVLCTTDVDRGVHVLLGQDFVYSQSLGTAPTPRRSVSVTPWQPQRPSRPPSAACRSTRPRL